MPQTALDGSPVIIPLFNESALTLVVAPLPGATALVEFTASPLTAVGDGTAIWADWSLGAVAHGERYDLAGTPIDKAYADVFDGPISALRITSAGGDTRFDYREAR